MGRGVVFEMENERTWFIPPKKKEILGSESEKMRSRSVRLLCSSVLFVLTDLTVDRSLLPLFILNSLPMPLFFFFLLRSSL